MSGRGFIAAEDPQTCEMCGTIDETRPYGPNYEEICFKCAMKDDELTSMRFKEYVLGVPPYTDETVQ